MKAPKTLNQIKSDPRVESVSDERSSDEGIWIYLREGYYDPKHDPHFKTTAIHERTVAEAAARMRDVVSV